MNAISTSNHWRTEEGGAGVVSRPWRHFGWGQHIDGRYFMPPPDCHRGWNFYHRPGRHFVSVRHCFEYRGLNTESRKPNWGLQKSCAGTGVNTAGFCYG